MTDEHDEIIVPAPSSSPVVCFLCGVIGGATAILALLLFGVIQ